jgi:hypothetical protein
MSSTVTHRQAAEYRSRLLLFTAEVAENAEIADDCCSQRINSEAADDGIRQKNQGQKNVRNRRLNVRSFGSYLLSCFCHPSYCHAIRGEMIGLAGEQVWPKLLFPKFSVSRILPIPFRGHFPQGTARTEFDDIDG